jgi:hypothetical protein
MSRRIVAIIFGLFAAVVVLLSVGYQLRAQQQGDVYSSGSGDRRNSNGRGECTCPLGANSPMWEVEMARIRPSVVEIGERESRLQERQQREWRIEVDGAGRGGSKAAAAAKERVQARQERETRDFQTKKGRAAKCLECRLQWISGGCCGSPPSCPSITTCMAYMEDDASTPERGSSSRRQPERPPETTWKNAPTSDPADRRPETIEKNAPTRDPADRRPETIEKSAECGQTMAEENARHERETMKNRRQREAENARYTRAMRRLDLRRQPNAGMAEEARHQSMLQQLGQDTSSIDKRHERCVLRLTAPNTVGPGPFKFQLIR